MISSISKPWGSEELLVLNEPSTVKILHVKKGEMFSLQYHNDRDEFWKILEGNPTIFINEKVIEAKIGDIFNILRGDHHRISAPVNDVSVLEVSTGQFDQNDIVRLEDKYNRI